MDDCYTFREELAISHPLHGHALWEPDPGGLYDVVAVGDVGFIREGCFYSLFNALRPPSDPNPNGPVGEKIQDRPKYPPQLRPKKSPHLRSSRDNQRYFCSKNVTKVAGGTSPFTLGPDDEAPLTFSCSGRQGALLYLPFLAERQDTVTRGDFGEWMLQNIDACFKVAEGHGCGVTRMEDIVLVTGLHRARSWVNVAFSENRVGAQVSFGVRVFGNSGVHFDEQHVSGRGLKLGPSGVDLPENQTIFVRGFRVVRTLSMWPRLRAAAFAPDMGGPGPEFDRGLQLTSVPVDAVDPLHLLAAHITEQVPDCDTILVHDDDLQFIGDTPLETLREDNSVRSTQNYVPVIRQVPCSMPCDDTRSGTEVVFATVATLSKDVFEAPHKDRHDLQYSRPMVIASRPENTLPQSKSLTTARLEPGALEIMNQLRHDKLQQDIRKWLSPPDPMKNHKIARESQHDGTTTWWTRGDTFAEWKSSGPSSLLWIHGKPGAGKNVICSSIIENIQEMRESKASLAFFYHDFKDDEKKYRGLISSLLVQLCDQSDAYCAILSDFYLAQHNGPEDASESELVQCLKTMLKVPKGAIVYIVIDALDECSTSAGLSSHRDNVLGFVEELVTLRAPNLRICVTSRPEADIEHVLSPLASHSVSLHCESGQAQDIAEYIKFVVNNDPGMGAWRKADKELVIDVLTKKADGMFRWVHCQLAYLGYCLSGRIRSAPLPKSLDETYERTLKDTGDRNREHARRLLQCVAVASRPLRVEELCEYLAFDSETVSTPKYSKDWYSMSRPITKAKDTVSRLKVSRTLASTIIALACKRIRLQRGESTSKTSPEKYPIAEYAGQHWIGHSQSEQVSPNIQDKMKHVFEFDPDNPYFSTWLWVYDPPRRKLPYNRTGYTSQDSRTILQYAVVCGMRDFIKLLVERSPDVNARGIDFDDTPLDLACSQGNLKAARVLLEHDPDKEIQYRAGYTPLYYVSLCGLLNLVQHLLDHREDMAAQGKRKNMPLHMASTSENADFFWEISAADVAAWAIDNYMPLNEASNDGCYVEKSRVLLEQGAGADDQNTWDETPLHLTPRGGLDLAQLLRKHRAGVRALADHGQKPFRNPLAFGRGHQEVMELILEHGSGGSRDAITMESGGSS